MRILSHSILICLILLATPLQAGIFDINTPAHIKCISNETAELIEIGEYEGDNAGDRLRAEFFKWVFDKVDNNLKANIDFVWTPSSAQGPQMDITTDNQTYHTLISVRSKTKNSIIVVSSASRVNTVVSWLFTFNFNLKTMLATEVRSGVAHVRGKVMTFNCKFEALTRQAASPPPNSATQ